VQKFQTYRLAAALAASIVTLIGVEVTAVTNPGFEDDALIDWSPTGQVGAFGQFKNFVDPTQGTQQMIMFTDRFAFQTRNAAASPSTLNDDLGVDISLALDGRSVQNGSAIRQTFSILEPTDLTFDWAFARRDDASSGNDVAFVMINQQAFVLTDLDSALFTRRGADSFTATDYATFTALPTLPTGTHEIVFGVVAIDTPGGRSALLVDNLQLTAAINGGAAAPPPAVIDPPSQSATPAGVTASNPEPVTVALVGMGLGAVGVATRRRRR
jgi:hypothetical protein